MRQARFAIAWRLQTDSLAIYSNLGPAITVFELGLRDTSIAL